MNTFKVLGVEVSEIGLQEALGFIEKKINQRQRAQIATVNNEFIVEAQRNKKFKQALNDSDLAIIDSVGIQWAIKRLYGKKVGRLPGADLVYKVCEISSKKGYKIFLLGGKKGVGQKAADKLSKTYPGISITGVIDGVIIEADKTDQEILEKINDSKADIVLVALGAPKQDLWIAHNISMLSPGVFIGVGGTLDFISGQITRAPKVIRSIGLEWLFRLVMQPTRIKRIITAVIVFPFMIIFQKSKA